MPLSEVFSTTVSRTRRLPLPGRLIGTLLCVGGAFASRAVLDPVWPAGFPFLIAMGGILAAASLFGELSGLLTTGLSAALAAFFYLPPTYSFFVKQPSHLVALGVFCLLGAVLTLVIETLHRSLDELRRAEAYRARMLREFKHRTKNDLHSLVSLLLLRAREAPPECRGPLKEAAAHALSLARVHSRLETAQPGADGEPQIGTREFVAGLASDILRALGGEAPRPIALVTDVENHGLDSERAVYLGTLLNGCLADALKHAFPGGRAGRIAVRFRREGAEFVLEVEDDGVGLGSPAVPGRLGTRILRALAAQLRGAFSRDSAAGAGTLCRLRFPVMSPGKVPPSLPVG